jgi:hypothetical protein
MLAALIHPSFLHLSSYYPFADLMFTLKLPFELRQLNSSVDLLLEPFFQK